MLDDLIKKIPNDWSGILRGIVEPELSLKLSTELNHSNVLPALSHIFHAFNMCSFENVKVVIIGQDCYPTAGHAMGLCFSVTNGVKCPPSLRNIFKELEHEYGTKRTNTDLTDWAQQGVLMLNTALTVRENCPGSHIKIWKDFTKNIIKYVSANKKHITYMLWGEHAIAYKKYIDEECNLVLTHSHPSPLARRPFVGNGHFTSCNSYLESQGKSPIAWC